MQNQKHVFLTAAIAAMSLVSSASASIIFDDFNVNEGHFGQGPTVSGNTSATLASSTADRVTTGAPFEGAGHEQLVLNHDSTTTAQRIRFLSGGGTPASNTAFTTSAAEDGWIGFYLKTSSVGWTAQLWLDPPSGSANGGVPKNVIADGAWHLYEWNLDDNSGGANGWGAIAGIIAGSATVLDGSHSIDSIVLRGPTTADSVSTLFVDFVAKSDSGSVSTLVPEPSTVVLGLVGGLGLFLVVRRRC